MKRQQTAEILNFVDKKQYGKISESNNGILYYSGRILSMHEFGGDPSLCKAAPDLTHSTFYVPSLIDRPKWFESDDQVSVSSKS